MKLHNYALSIGTKIDDLEWPWTAISPNFLGISHTFADLGGSNERTDKDRPVLCAMELYIAH